MHVRNHFSGNSGVHYGEVSMNILLLCVHRHLLSTRCTVPSMFPQRAMLAQRTTLTKRRYTRSMKNNKGFRLTNTNNRHFPRISLHCIPLSQHLQLWSVMLWVEHILLEFSVVFAMLWNSSFLLRMHTCNTYRSTKCNFLTNKQSKNRPF